MNKPMMRFSGFDDEWVEKKLGKIGSTYIGLKGKTKADFGVGDGEYVTFSNIMNNGIADINLTDKTPIDDSQNEVLYGDLLFTISSETFEEVGMSSVWLDNRPNVYLNSFSFGYKPSADVDSLYLGYLLRSENIRRKFIRLGQGISRINISKNRIMDVGIPIPELPEQQQIGNFFKTIDDLISAEEEQLSNFETYKEAMLQKMFPKKHETNPEVRFDGYDEDWVEVPLGESFNRKVSKGRSDIPYITVSETETNTRTDGAQGYGTNTSEKAMNNSKILLDGEFLIDLSTYERGIYMSRADGLTSNAYHVLELVDGDPDYWSRYFITHNFVQSLKSITPPGARQGKMIEVAELIRRPVPTPSKEEQEQIGNFFKTLDELIRNKKEKIEQLKEVKESFLQKMFA